MAAGLRRQGFEVDHTARGGEALSACRRADVVLLDLGVRDLPGPHVCRDIKAVSGAPVLALSGDGTEATRVRALRAGAGDCLDKPFGFRELVARIEAIMRRVRAARPPATAPVPELPVKTDPVARKAWVGGRELCLTEKEFDLLHLLVSRPGTVVSREEIMARVWGDPRNRRSRTVDTHVAGLRRKLGRNGWITTVRGVGFRFAPTGYPAPAGPADRPAGAESRGDRVNPEDREDPGDREDSGGREGPGNRVNPGDRADRPGKAAPLSVVRAS